MDDRNEIRDFLVSRRARITPEQAGLPAYGGNRRVAGLRREEVALLAGVSIDYYTRLERGKAHGVSESVLEGLGFFLALAYAETSLKTSRGSRPSRYGRRSPRMYPPLVTGSPATMRRAVS
jgi:transcriptional regulator with XRE-family HTH domain